MVPYLPRSLLQTLLHFMSYMYISSFYSPFSKRFYFSLYTLTFSVSSTGASTFFDSFHQKNQQSITKNLLQFRASSSSLASSFWCFMELYSGSVSSYDHAAIPSKETMLMRSGFFGVILCFLVYRSTAALSSQLFKGYSKLSTAKRIEWNNRGISTFHSLFISIASFYLLIISDIFKDGSHHELLVNRSSTLSNTVLGISIGYFVTDLAMILWHFPALGGLEYILHHGLSMFAIIVSLLSGQVQIYVLMVLLSESTTPFVNLRWYLDVAGLKSSKLYIVNGIAMFLGWLVARIFLFVFFFFHVWTHFDEFKEVFPLAFYTLIVVSSALAMMNIFWFWKIAKGMVKTLEKAKRSKRA